MPPFPLQLTKDKSSPKSGYSLILWCPRAAAKRVWIYTPSQEAALPGTATLQPHPCKRDQAGFDSTSEGMWWSLMLLALFLLPELSSWGCAGALQFAMWHFRWEAKGTALPTTTLRFSAKQQPDHWHLPRLREKAALSFSPTIKDAGKQTCSLGAKRSSPSFLGIPMEGKGVMLF